MKMELLIFIFRIVNLRRSIVITRTCFVPIVWCDVICVCICENANVNVLEYYCITVSGSVYLVIHEIFPDNIVQSHYYIGEIITC